jgi:hypothetical protein
VAAEAEQRKSAFEKQGEDRAFMLSLNKRDVEAQERIADALETMLHYMKQQ